MSHHTAMIIHKPRNTNFWHSCTHCWNLPTLSSFRKTSILPVFAIPFVVGCSIILIVVAGFISNAKKMARQSSHAFLRKMRRCREKETEVARGTIHQRLAQGNGFFCRSCARVLQCQFGSAEPQSPTFLCTDCLCAVSLKRALARFRGILGLPNAGSVEPHFSESRFPL